jgi:serine/threonine-protein kinase
MGEIVSGCYGGGRPFSGGLPVEVFLEDLQRKPGQPRAGRPQTEPNLEVLALKCATSAPEGGYASAGELAGDLERWLRGEPVEVVSEGVLTVL